MSSAHSETSRVLDNAISAHQQLKTAMLVAIASGVKLEVASIRPDDCCELGRWLHAEGKSCYGSRPSFTVLLETHADFHVVASVVASLLNGNARDQTTVLLAGRSKFAAVSRALGIAIMRLKGELQAAPASE